MLHSLTNPPCLIPQKREELREIINISFDIDTRHINALSVQNIELLNVKKKLVVHIVTTRIWIVKVLANNIILNFIKYEKYLNKNTG